MNKREDGKGSDDNEASRLSASTWPVATTTTTLCQVHSQNNRSNNKMLRNKTLGDTGNGKLQDLILSLLFGSWQCNTIDRIDRIKTSMAMPSTSDTIDMTLPCWYQFSRPASSSSSASVVVHIWCIKQVGTDATEEAGWCGQTRFVVDLESMTFRRTQVVEIR